MDYTEAFKNLRTNNKWGRKSPHKAVLMLTVIEMFEQNILTDNEIFYDEKLKSMFLKVWNRVLPEEPLFHPDAYLPFWYLQSDSFWHIVPKRGQEDILSLMRDNNVKPSEVKLNESVRCAELDEDLYFLMTLPSGRSSLKRVLLETYTSLSERQIDRLSESVDNTVDYSATAQSEYEKILSHGKGDKVENVPDTDQHLVRQFQKLSEDVQIEINLQYYSFLKQHRSERDIFREMFPSVYELLDKIVNHPIKQVEMSPSFVFVYDNFLSDLKISLMSEDGAMELVDKIGDAIEILRGNVTTVVDEETEEEEIVEEESTQDSEDNVDIEEGHDDSGDLASGELEVEHVFMDRMGNRVDSGVMKLKDYAYFEHGEDTGVDENNPEQEEVDESSFTIENSFMRCYILNKHGEKVFSEEGKLKYLSGKLYRMNFKNEGFTLKRMEFNGAVWLKGEKKIVAYPQSALYRVIDNSIGYCDEVEEIVDSPVFEDCQLKVKGVWYRYNGSPVSDNSKPDRDERSTPEPNRDVQKAWGIPHYAERKQAVLRAMGFFRLPAKIKDIVRTISRTAWGSTIKEEDVEVIIGTIPEIESVDGKYILQERLNKKQTSALLKNTGKTNKIEKKEESKNIPTSYPTRRGSRILAGYWIQWKPTGVIGKVVGFMTKGSLHKILLRKKTGEEIEVYDNPSMYEIVKK